MATFRWQAPGSGAFDSNASWDMGSVPGATDRAELFGNGGGISGTGSVDTLAFLNAGWTLVGDLTTTTATIDYSTVSVNGSTSKLVVNGALAAGRTGAATVIVEKGGRLVTTPGASGPASSFGNANLTVRGDSIVSFGSPLNLGAGGTTVATVDGVVDPNAAVRVIHAAVLGVGGIMQLGSAAGGAASLLVTSGGQVALTAGKNTNQNYGYLQIGAAAGSSGTVQVSGANALLLVASNAATVGVAGTGSLVVSSGGAVRFATANNPLDPALAIGGRNTDTDSGTGSGTVTLSDSGTSLTANGRIMVGATGNGTMRITGGATASSAAVASTEAALSVAAIRGRGALAIDGAGSQLLASGQAVIGGDNRGSGFTAGGLGTVALTGGAFLQTGAMTIFAGSSLTIDGASREVIGGTLTTSGTLTSAGTLQVTGAATGGGILRIAAGVADLGALASGSVAFAGPSATLFVRGVSGTSLVTGMQYGNRIDLVGNSSVRLSGNTVTTATGVLQLGAAPADAAYQLSGDGAGGTFISLTASTIGVYRFFDSNYGTHFFSSSISEKDTIIGTRPDLVYEGVGLQSIDPASSDPNAAPVYRFFDTSYGTHFFTASAAERDTVIASRADLLYEGTGFTEHTTQQTGDVAVYRFFDTKYGTHFYTADANERATVIATRPDLIDEGTGFWAPSQG